MSDEVVRACGERNIELVAHPTTEAVRQYTNLAAADRRLGACFHLAC